MTKTKGRRGTVRGDRWRASIHDPIPVKNTSRRDQLPVHLKVAETAHIVPLKIYFFGKAEMFLPNSKQVSSREVLFCFEVLDRGDYYQLTPNNKAYDISMAFGPKTTRIPKHPAFKRSPHEAAAYHIVEKRMRIDEIRARLDTAVKALEGVYNDFVYRANLDIEVVERYAEIFYEESTKHARKRKKSFGKAAAGAVVPGTETPI
jgi:hypothetical protein